MSKYLKYEHKTQSHVDQLCYKIAEYALPIMRRLNFTPNIITMIGFLFKLTSIYLLLKTDRVVLAAILFFIGYIFDCLDGAYARQYDMVTDLGDYLDHGCDIISAILLIIVVYIKFGFEYTLVILLLFVLATYHISCQEATIEDNNKSNTITDLCADTRHAERYRFIGCGNMMFLITIALIIIFWRCS